MHFFIVRYQPKPEAPVFYAPKSLVMGTSTRKHRTCTHLVSNGVGAAAVTLLSDGELDTLALGEGDPGLLGADNENVGLAGSEGVVKGILDVDDVETTIVTLTVGDDTNTAHVTTASNHGDGTSVELDEVLDLASLKVDLDSVVDLDQGVGVANAVCHAHGLVNRGKNWTYQPYRSLLEGMCDAAEEYVPPFHTFPLYPAEQKSLRTKVGSVEG